MNLQYMNLGITETDCTQSLRFWSNFDPNLPSEDGRNQKQQSGYPNKSKSRPYLLLTFNKLLLLYLGFFRVQMGNPARVKDQEVTA